MQTITSPTVVLDTLYHLSCGFTADPYSWQDWHILAVETVPVLHGEAQEKIADITRTLLSGHDGVVLCCADGVCLSVFQHKYHLDLEWFEEALRQSLINPDLQTTIRMHSVRSEPAEVQRYFDRYVIGSLSGSTDCGTAPDFSKSVHQLVDLEKYWDRTREKGLERTKPQVMIVDDDACTRSVISHTLKKDYAVITAETCAEAIHKQILFAPNVVFLDIGLPDHSGLDLLHYIRAHDAQSRVVIFSSQDYLKNRLTAFAEGADGFVAKPFNREAFKHYIDGWKKTSPFSWFRRH